jgi:DNA-binding NarL/FixJ family response regulator
MMSMPSETRFVAPRGRLPARKWVHQGGTPLTDRERQVLSLLALGYTNREAASILGLSCKTVEAHRAHTLNKLGLRTRSELVHYALREGYLTPETPGPV